MSMTAAEELAQAEERLAAYRAAELRILKSQSWSKDGSQSERAKLEDVRNEIEKLTKRIRELSTKSGGKIRARLGVVSYE